MVGWWGGEGGVSQAWTVSFPPIPREWPSEAEANGVVSLGSSHLRPSLHKGTRWQDVTMETLPAPAFAFSEGLFALPSGKDVKGGEQKKESSRLWFPKARPLGEQRGAGHKQDAGREAEGKRV